MPYQEHETSRPLVRREVTRREFARLLSGATAGGSLLAAALAGCTLTPSQKAEAGEAIVDKLGKLPKRRYGRRMGNMMVVPIAICQDNSPDLLGPCLDAGMNFVHKASYWRELPEEIKRRPRESFYCDITVDNTSPRHDPENYDEAYNQVIEQLDRTGLKYFDIFRAHYGWHTKASFNKGDNASYRAFQRLKRERKVRYFGVSQHSKPENYLSYAEMIQEQIDSGLIDSIQVWCHYASDKDALAVFEKAHRAGIAVTAMKTVAHGGDAMRSDGARQVALKAPGMVGRACLRHVLSMPGSDGKPYVDCCVSSLRNFAMFEENIGAIAPKVAFVDGFHRA
jgi:predicted aldo/keto reductase-like oxidoreductase